MATTLDDLIESVEGLLHGHTGQDEQLTYLKYDITSTDLSIEVNSVEGVRRGIVEIGDELLWVDSVNTSSNTLNIAPFGRGYRGTTAAAHAAEVVPVSVNPLLPRSRIRSAINETIEAVGGELFGVSNATIVYDSGTVGYELPSASFPNLMDVLSATWYSENTTEMWIPIRRWKFIDKADVTAFPSGKAIEFYDPIRNGTDVNVTYTSTPLPFSNDVTEASLVWIRKNYPEYSTASDEVVLVVLAASIPDNIIDLQTFTEVTNLPSSAKDVITYGAAARLAWAIEGGRTNQTGVSSTILADSYGTNWRGAANNFGKQLYAFFEKRLQEERDQLLRTTQPTIHYLR